MEAVQVDGKRKSIILGQYDEKIRTYSRFAEDVEHQVKSLLEASQITYNSITHRVKTRYSLAEKIDRKNKYKSIEEITDIVGVRVITYYSEDVDRVASIIEAEFDVDHENSIDKREALEPEKFGYCSVHYVVSMSSERLGLTEYQGYRGMKCEIQIRSVLQHAWAEIEHDTGYKSEKPIPKELRRSFSRIAGLLEIADKEFDEIRRTLSTYKKAATENLDKQEFGEKELDAIIIDAAIQTDSDLRLLNTHIESLIKERVCTDLDSFDVTTTIDQLNWVGVKTVNDLLTALHDYSELAMRIANEVLKGKTTSDRTYKVTATIGLFYLCYAILLAKGSGPDVIYRYMKENHIDPFEDHGEFIQQLVSIGENNRQ